MENINCTFLRKFRCTEGSFTAYEFRTDINFYLEEAGYEVDLFRVEIYKDYAIVYVANEDGYWIHDEVTYLFNAERLIEQAESAEDVEDVQEEWEEFLAENGE